MIEGEGRNKLKAIPKYQRSGKIFFKKLKSLFSYRLIIATCHEINRNSFSKKLWIKSILMIIKIIHYQPWNLDFFENVWMISFFGERIFLETYTIVHNMCTYNILRTSYVLINVL